MVAKANILIVGMGGVGTIMAYNLELGGKATVSCVCRSNYKAVEERGFNIDSCDYGKIKGWKPSGSIYNSVPTASRAGWSMSWDEREGMSPPFDFVICTTKNIPDVPPSLASLIAPAVAPHHTTIVLGQNGLNIEEPIIEAFPNNVILSSIILMGAHELEFSNIVQDDKDIQRIGPFRNPNLKDLEENDAAKDFVDIYNAAGIARAEYNLNVGYERWRKLIYNSSFNPICAILGMDTSRLRYSKHAVEDLVRPAMQEIRATAKAKGFDLPENLVQGTIDIDPIEVFLKPSMQTDMQKGNHIEFENILGEPLREAEKLSVPTPTLKVLYGICRALQWRTMERRGLIELPGK